MNKDNAKDYLPLVQALAEGKVIQGVDGGGEWEDLREVHFAQPSYQYRIKPEPLVIYAAMNSTSEQVFLVGTEIHKVTRSVSEWPGATDGKVRKFVEVIED